MWNFPCIIICRTSDNLQDVFDQVRETFDRYTDAPFATDTNSNTYTRADIQEGIQDPRLPKFVIEVTVQLSELFSSVVIA